MVFFTCAGCGESLKKCQVEKHRFRCRRSNHLTCIDCCKDFFDEDYQTHTKCISEDQKYGGANYVAKENKGEVKQEKWFETVQTAIDRLSKSDHRNKRLLSLLEGLRRYPNVPRKEAKFKNFAKSSFRTFDESVVIEAWAAIKSVSDELNPPKPPPTPAKQESSNVQNAHPGGESAQNDKKRKKNDSEIENSNDNAPEPSPAKKKSKKEKHDKLNSQENIPDEKSPPPASEEREDVEKSQPPPSAEEYPSPISLKSLVKKLLKQSENGELTLKRLKKYVGKEMQCTNEEQKVDLYAKIDEFLKKNIKKYATDGKIVRFACKS